MSSSGSEFDGKDAIDMVAMNAKLREQEMMEMIV